MHILSSAVFFSKLTFSKNISGILSVCQTIWIQIPNLGLNSLQSVSADKTSRQRVNWLKNDKYYNKECLPYIFVINTSRSFAQPCDFLMTEGQSIVLLPLYSTPIVSECCHYIPVPRKRYPFPL